jgi:lysophospholipase L1-like esterase
VPLLEVRHGIPAFARRLQAGEPATVVAFGTSLTYRGQYLAHLLESLKAYAGDAGVRLVNRGLRGFCTHWAAFNVAAEVLPERPDLVLIEFAHNDVNEYAYANCPPALDGIIAQIRELNPACEFVFVYLARAGTAVAGPTQAMRIHEEVAEYYGISSIDLATLTERLVAAGDFSWTGEGAPALTVDGVHHAPLVAGVLGIPFAQTFVKLLRASSVPRPPEAPVRDLLLARASRAPASRFIATGSWGRGALQGGETQFQAYNENVAAATEPGATLRVPFTGRQAYAWLMGAGPITVRLNGSDEPFEIEVRSIDRWIFRPLMPLIDASDIVLEITAVQAPVIFGDLYFVGAAGRTRT